METSLLASLLGLTIIIILFLVFRIVVWWYWGIDKALKNLENIQNQLEGINHKMNLFAKKFDVADNNKKEKIKPKVEGDIVTCPKCNTPNPINFDKCRACGFSLK